MTAPRRSRSADEAVFHRLLTGVGSGVVATAGMSVVLAAAALTGLLRPMPPWQITRRVFPSVSERTTGLLTALGHTAYGAAAAALYTTCVAPSRAGPSSGAGYGLALWAAGYEVWVPVARLLPPAHRDRPTRVIVMVAAHVIYGMILGALEGAHARERSRPRVRR